MKDEPLPWSVQQAIEKVKINIQWRKTNEEDVENWLHKFFNIATPDFSKPSKWYKLRKSARMKPLSLNLLKVVHTYS